MDLKPRTIMEKANLLFAIIAAVLILAVYFLSILQPVEPSYSLYIDAYVLLRKTIMQAIDMLPFLLMLIFSIMQKKSRFRYARWMPAVVLFSRVFVDCVAEYAKCASGLEHLSFVTLFVEALDGFFWIPIILHLVYLLVALSLSRWGYTLASISGLSLFMSVGIPVLSIDPTAHNVVWFLAYLFWYTSLMFLGVTITPYNSYIRALKQIVEGLWKEMAPNDEFSLYQVTDVYEHEGIVYVLLNTPDEKTLILTKRAQDSGSDTIYNLIQINEAFDEYDTVLDDFPEEE